MLVLVHIYMIKYNTAASHYWLLATLVRQRRGSGEASFDGSIDQLCIRYCPAGAGRMEVDCACMAVGL